MGGEVLARGARVLLRRPAAEDEPAFLEMARASVSLHHPWAAPPSTPEAFAAYLERSAAPATLSALIAAPGSPAVIGVITLSQIFYGPLCSAYAGYYVGAAHAGQGYMREGLALMLGHAFGPLGLHRVEANIQPANLASIALVRRLGFTREGYSRRYLRIDGEWRDHERWAILAEDWAGQG